MLYMPIKANNEGGVKRGPLIVISGSPGSGKSTYARRLAEDFNLTYYSSGAIFRSIARELGISLVELNKRAEESIDIDVMVEAKTLELASRGNIVIDSHIAAWILASIADILIYVKAPLHIRAQRVAGRDNISYSKALENIVDRELSHWTRFMKYYGIDTLDLSIFHLVIDTSIYSIEEAYNIIKLAVKQRLEKLGHTKSL